MAALQAQVAVLQGEDLDAPTPTLANIEAMSDTSALDDGSAELESAKEELFTADNHPEGEKLVLAEILERAVKSIVKTQPEYRGG